MTGANPAGSRQAPAHMPSSAHTASPLLKPRSTGTTRSRSHTDPWILSAGHSSSSTVTKSTHSAMSHARHTAARMSLFNPLIPIHPECPFTPHVPSHPVWRWWNFPMVLSIFLSKIKWNYQYLKWKQYFLFVFNKIQSIIFFLFPHRDEWTCLSSQNTYLDLTFR